MDTVNVLKGYGKVSHRENQVAHQKPTRKPLICIIAISAILVLTLIIGLMLAAIIHESNTEPPDSSSLSSSESIKAVCSVTRYPDSCFTSLSSVNSSTKPDPEAIFRLSLQVSMTELSKFSSSLKTFNDLHGEAALSDCKSLFENAMSRLNDSLSATEVSPGEKVLTEAKINDLQTWISSAMTDQETCSDGLEEMGSPVVDQVKNQMQRSKELLSNSLAIIAKMQTLLEKFDLKMH